MQKPPRFGTFKKITKCRELKIAVVGSAGVGKATLIDMFFRNKMRTQDLLSGLYLQGKKHVTLNNVPYFLKITICSSVDVGDAIPKDIANSDGFLFVFTNVSKESFEYLKKMRPSIERNRISQLFPMVVVGNFAGGADDGEVAFSEMKQFATKYEAPYMQVTFEDASLVHKCFMEIANQILQVESGFDDDDSEYSTDSSSGESMSSYSDEYTDESDIEISGGEAEKKSDEKPVSTEETEKDTTQLIRTESVSSISTHTEEEVKDMVEDGFLVVREGGKVKVKAGKLESLITRLTHHKYPDNAFLFTFLLSFRGFTTPSVLLSLLIRRYCLEPPPKASPSAAEAFKNAVIKPTRLRVYNAMKHWLENYFNDFRRDPLLLMTLISFIISVMVPNDKLSGKQLSKTIVKKLRMTDTSELGFAEEAPKPILGKKIEKSKEFSLLDIDSKELARQLTLIETEMYRQIDPTECVNQPWAKEKTRYTKAANVTRMVSWFNAVSQYVITEILLAPKQDVRMKVYKKFIEVGQHCIELNNFNGVMEVISGFDASAVYRLNLKEQLDKKHLEMLDEMTAIMNRSGSFKSYRQKIHNVNPPCIPYLGCYLSDLTFKEDGSADFLENGMINFEKRNLVAATVVELMQYQQTPYNLTVVDVIRDFLMNVKFLTDEEEQFDVSFMIVPKKSKAAQAKKGPKPNIAEYTPKTIEKFVNIEEPPKKEIPFKITSEKDIEGVCAEDFIAQIEEIFSGDDETEIYSFTEKWKRMYDSSELDKKSFGLEIDIFKFRDEKQVGLFSFLTILLRSRLFDLLVRRTISKPEEGERDIEIMKKFPIITEEDFTELIKHLRSLSKLELSKELQDKVANACSMFAKEPLNNDVIENKEEIEWNILLEEYSIQEMQEQEGYLSVSLGIMQMKRLKRLMGLYEERRLMLRETKAGAGWKRNRKFVPENASEIFSLTDPQSEAEKSVDKVLAKTKELFLEVSNDDESKYQQSMRVVTGDYLESMERLLQMMVNVFRVLIIRFQYTVPYLRENNVLGKSIPTPEEEDSEGEEEELMDESLKLSRSMDNIFAVMPDEEDTSQESDLALIEFLSVKDRIFRAFALDCFSFGLLLSEVKEVNEAINMFLMIWRDPGHEQSRNKIKSDLKSLNKFTEQVFKDFPEVKDEVENPQFNRSEEDDKIPKVRRGSRAVQLDVTEVKTNRIGGLKTRRDSGSPSNGQKNLVKEEEFGTFEERDQYKEFYSAVAQNEMETFEFLRTKYPNFDVNFKPNSRAISLMHLAAKNKFAELLESLLDAGGRMDSVNHKGLTVLHYAVDNCSSECVKVLLDRGANVECMDTYEQTPLHFATSRRDFETLSLLLKAGANVNRKTLKGSTPLHLISNKSGKKQIAEILLKYGSDINATTPKHLTALHFAATNNNKKLVQYLLEHGAEVDPTDIDGQTPLYAATMKQNSEIVRYLLEQNSNVNIKDAWGQNLLHWAISAGDVESARLFIEKGIDIEQPISGGNTCTHLAAKNNQLESMRLLIKHNANINKENDKKGTPLHYAAKQGGLEIVKLLVENKANVEAVDQSGWTPIFHAVDKAEPKILEFLLLQDDVDVNRKEFIDGSTPLHTAAFIGNSEIGKVLLAHSAWVNAENNYKETPLHIAAHQKRLDFSQLLLSSGAVVDAKTKWGSTPLHLAVRVSDETISDLLLKKECDLNAKTIDGMTCMHLAAASGHVNLLAHLLDEYKRHSQLEMMSTLRVDGIEPGELNKIKEELKIKALADFVSKYVNGVDDNGDTPLHYAAKYNKRYCCAVLLESGANVNSKNEEGSTPFMVACANYSSETAGYLLEHQTAVNKIYTEEISQTDFMTSKFSELQEGRISQEPSPELSIKLPTISEPSDNMSRRRTRR